MLAADGIPRCAPFPDRLFHSRQIMMMNLHRWLLSPAMILLLALAAGCSGESPSDPGSPWGEGEPDHVVNTLFYWEREILPDTTRFESLIWLSCAPRNRIQGVDAGTVRFAGAELRKQYYQDDASYSYRNNRDSSHTVEIAGKYEGTFIINAEGTSDFPAFADTIPVKVSEPLITSPLPGDTVSISKGFVLNWSREWSAGMVEITFISPEGTVYSRGGRVADNGTLVVEPDMVEGMEPGRWTIQVEREYRYNRIVGGWLRSNAMIQVRSFISVEAME